MKLQHEAVVCVSPSPFQTPADQTQRTLSTLSEHTQYILRLREHAYWPDGQKWPNMVKMAIDGRRAIGPHTTNKGKWGIPEIMLRGPPLYLTVPFSS